jgi:hypothetical protein
MFIIFYGLEACDAEMKAHLLTLTDSLCTCGHHVNTCSMRVPPSLWTHCIQITNLSPVCNLFNNSLNATKEDFVTPPPSQDNTAKRGQTSVPRITPGTGIGKVKDILSKWAQILSEILKHRHDRLKVVG